MRKARAEPDLLPESDTEGEVDLLPADVNKLEVRRGNQKLGACDVLHLLNAEAQHLLLFGSDAIA